MSPGGQPRHHAGHHFALSATWQCSLYTSPPGPHFPIPETFARHHHLSAQCKCTVRLHCAFETELFSAVDIGCVRPEGWLDRGTGKLFLPFDDDPVLSLILSKAFLLAGDAAITDESIARQIGGS